MGTPSGDPPPPRWVVCRVPVEPSIWDTSSGSADPNPRVFQTACPPNLLKESASRPDADVPIAALPSPFLSRCPFFLPRSRHAAATLRDTIYVFGGSVGQCTRHNQPTRLCMSQHGTDMPYTTELRYHGPFYSDWGYVSDGTRAQFAAGQYPEVSETCMTRSSGRNACRGSGNRDPTSLWRLWCHNGSAIPAACRTPSSLDSSGHL